VSYVDLKSDEDKSQVSRKRRISAVFSEKEMAQRDLVKEYED